MDDIWSGNMQSAEYLKIASDLKAYMDSTGRSPDYMYGTTLGTHLGFENLVYMYSKVLNFYKSARYLPNYAEMKNWNVVMGKASEIPSWLQQYLVATANCQVNDAQINALAWSICQGSKDIYAATNIFNWVRDHLSYSFYYDTQYGAVGALNAGTGNCVDTSHLVVALSRAAGIPARYEHVYAQFSSGSWYGHVIAQLWVNGVWYNADASSNYNTFGNINNWNTGTATYKGDYASLPF